MAILNYVKREIVAKIVYYGPGLSGKTLNIQKVHENMDPQNVGELTSLATESDRTLFFDFVPIQLGKIAGLETRFQLFTVPGQVFYNQTRRRVLEDADGVVFVADSQPEQLENNLESLANLEENLAFYGKKLSEVPFVIQFNKQDIPGCMTEDELNKVLNKYNAPAIRASCFENFGVMETLAKISTTVLAHLREQMTRKAAPNAPPTGIKRTYSKEGVSDEQVVKNLLEDIAASGGIAEAQAAGDIKPPAAPLAKPATPPVAPPKPIAPAAAGAPKPPPPRPAAAPRPIVPGAAPSGPRPAAAAAGAAGLSAEDLLSDLDSPAPAPKPTAPPRPPSGPAPAANKPGPAPVAPPRPTPSAAAPRPAVPAPKPPVPPPSSAPRPMASGPVPTAPVTNGGQTNAGLRIGGTPPPRPSPPPARTADELLESMERSTDAGLAQENGGGSFDTARNKKKTGNPLWDADDEEASTAAMSAKPASILDDIDESAGGGRTNVANVGAMLRGGAEPAPPAPAPKKPAPSNPDSTAGALFDAELRVSSVGAPERGEDGSLEFDVQISDGTRDVPVRLVIPQAALKGIAGPSKSGGGGALFLGILNLLLLLGLGTFNVLAFLGMIGR